MYSKNQGNHESIESEPSEKMEVDNDEDSTSDAAPDMRKNKRDDQYSSNAWSSSLRSFLFFNNPNLEKPTKRRSLPLSPKTYLYVFVYFSSLI